MMLIAGGNGSIGRRYQAILRYLNYPFKVYDVNYNPSWREMRDAIQCSGATKLLITTPTIHHADWCRVAIEKHVPFLCEKPATTSVDEAKAIAVMINESFRTGFVVNNWAFLFRYKPKKIRYNFYNTGRDGLLWDVVQLIYLANAYQAELEVRTDSYKWEAWIDEFHVPYQMIEQSYVHMMRAFIEEDSINLWTYPTAIQQTEIVTELLKQLGEKEYEGFAWNSGANEIYPITREDLSKDRAAFGAGMGFQFLQRSAQETQREKEGIYRGYSWPAKR